MTHTASPVKKLMRIASAVMAGVNAWRVILVLLLACIAVLALMPAPPSDFDTGWDKLNHWLAFGSLAFAACLSSPASRTTRLLLLLSLLGFGGLIEVAQSYVPGRSAEWADLLADAIGIASGAAVAIALLGAFPATRVSRR